MEQQRDWRVNSDEVLDDLEGCHPADRVRTLALDLAQCGQEVHELRQEVEHLKAVIKQMRQPR